MSEPTLRRRRAPAPWRACVAGLALFGALCAAPARAAAQQDEVAQSRVYFQRGVQLYDARSFAPALAEFQSAAAVFRSPNSELYVARCLRELGLLAQAAVEFERTVRDAEARVASEPRYTATLQAARAELAALEPQIGRLALAVTGAPAGAVVQIGGREVALASFAAAFPVMPGRLPVVVTAPGRAPARGEVEVAAGQLAQLALVMDPPAGSVAATRPLARREGSPAAGTAAVAAAPRADARTRGERGPARDVAGAPHGWRPASRALVPLAAGLTVLGVGVAAAAAFAGFGLTADERYRTLAVQCHMMPCPADNLGAIRQGQAFEIATNVSLGVGIAALAAGAVLTILSGVRTPAAPALARRGARLGGRVAPGGLAVAGSF